VASLEDIVKILEENAVYILRSYYWMSEGYANKCTVVRTLIISRVSK